jgi:hypothetical protein
MWYKKLTPFLLFLIVFQSIPVTVLAGVSQEIPLTNPSVENCGVLSFLFGCQQNTQQGSTSVIGIQGLQGAAGPAGGNNTRWWTGLGAPSDGLGSDNDFYLEDNGAVYCKTAGTWGASLLSIIGPIGPAGPAGPPGAGGMTAGDLKEVENQFEANDSHWSNDAITAASANISALGTAGILKEAENQFAANDTSILNQAIISEELNISHSVTGWQSNLSALNATIDARIVGNLSTASTAGAVKTADTHITENLSVVSGWIVSNNTQMLLATQSNLSALNATIDARIVGNLSTASTAGAVKTADTHITENLSVVSNWIVVNLTAGGNISAPLNIADQHILSNKTEIYLGVQSNLSALNQTIDARIVGNLSTASTAGAIKVADTHITENLSVVSNWIVVNLTSGGNISAPLNIADQHILSNKTEIYLGVQANLSALNATIDARIVGNLSTASTAGAVKTADTHITENLSVVSGWIVTNYTKTLTDAQANLSALNATIDTRFTMNDTQKLATLSGWIVTNLTQAGNTSAGLALADGHILSNKTEIYLGVQANLSALNATIDARIVGNLSSGATAAQILAIDTRIGENKSAAIKTSDTHLTENLSVVSGWIVSNNTQMLLATQSNLSALNATIDTRFKTNDTAILLSASNLITNNLSVISGWIVTNYTKTLLDAQTNLSALNATIDARIVGNLSSGATAAQILAIDTRIGENQSKAVLGSANLITYNLSVISQWILSNQTTVFNNVHVNESAMVLADINMDTINRTAGDIRVGENKSAAILTGANLITNNLSVISGWIVSNNTQMLLATQSNLSALNATIDARIVGNLSAVSTAGAVKTADTHITENLSVVSNWIVVNLTAGGNVSAPLAAADAHILSNKTEIYLGVQANLSALNQTIDARIVGNLSGGAATLLTADQHIQSNRSEFNTWVQENRSAVLAVADAHIATNSTGGLTGDVTYYTNPDTGDDGNVGDAANPFKTVQHAVDIIPKQLNGHWATIYMADADYFESIEVNGTHGGEFWLRGAGGETGTVLIGNLSIIDCSAYVDIYEIAFHLASDDDEGISIETSTVFVEYLYFSEKTGAVDTVAVHADSMSLVYIESIDNRAGFDDVDYGLESMAGSIIMYDNDWTATHLTSKTLTKTDFGITIDAAAFPYTSGNLAAADNHITSNLSTISGWLVTNNTAMMTAQAANRSLWANFSVMAQSMIVPTTNGATIYAPNESLGAAPVVYLGFPRGQWNASIELIMPSSWTGGPLTPTYYWTADSGAGTVEWDFAARCTGDNGEIASFFGANTTVLDTLQTKDRTHIIQGAATTPSGSPAASALCQLLFRRLSGAGTLTTEAKLRGVQIAYPVV